MRRTVVDGKKGSGRKADEGRVSAGTHGWVWPARSPRRGSSCGQTAQPPWRPSLPGRVASDCVGGRPRGRRETPRCVPNGNTFISLRTAKLACWRMAHSLGRRQNTFLPRLFARTNRPKRGSSSDGRASALHAEGRGIDALLLQIVFFAFFSLTGSRTKPELRFPEASNDAGLRPLSRKITRFPVFSLLFWPLVSSPRPIRNRRRPIRTVVPIVRSRIPGATRHHLRVTNDRVERRRRSLAGPHSAPTRHAAVSGPSETARPGTPSSTSPEATHARERHRQGPPHLNARRSEQLG